MRALRNRIRPDALVTGPPFQSSGNCASTHRVLHLQGYGEFKVGDGAAGIAFDGKNLWVANNGDSNVMKLSPDGAVIATYITGKGPFGVVFDGSQVWVSNFASNSVSRTAAN